jgi:hypothetical protein
MTSISSQELQLWAAYDEIEPFGDHVTHHMLAQLAALLYNTNRGKGAAKSASDFLPKRERQADDDGMGTFMRFLAWGKQHGRTGNTGS